MKNIKHSLYTLLFLIIAQATSAQSTKKITQDTITWKKNAPLTFADFKSKTTPNNNPAYAYTSMILYQKAPDFSAVHIEAIFIRSKSFMKEKAEPALKHEQIHFDIAELYARKMRKGIAQIDYTKATDVPGEVKKIYDKAASDCNKEHQLYDKDVQGGMNAIKQKEWNAKIAARIKELNAFSETIVQLQ